MFTVREYKKVSSMKEAWELNQKKNNVILGGLHWLKTGNRSIGTAIDLSGLGLDKIEETDERFTIGCMTTLRQLEESDSLRLYFGNIFKECTRHIVGTQFRNSATIGGSIAGKFGFSDILTCLLCLDSYVELYEKGIVPLSEYSSMLPDSDIIIRIIIKKDQRNTMYFSRRNTQTDLPVLNCAVSCVNGTLHAVFGARPGRGKLIIDQEHLLSGDSGKEEIQTFLDTHKEKIMFDSNMRASAKYRAHLAKIFLHRAIQGGIYDN